jgi:bacterioferritin
MKAKEGVVERLNKVLTAELTAVHQYLLHAALCDNWGYERLEHHFKETVNEEVSHASGLIDHILYLDGTPNVERLDRVASGATVADLFKADLKFEQDDVQLLREAIAHCAKVGDFTTRHLLEHMVVDSEEHVDWFETQLEAVKQVGLERYLAEQLHKEGS